MKTNRYALISVYDKSNLEVAAKNLVDRKYVIIASEGTGKYLKRFKIPYSPVDIFTKNPDILKDCIQTISFNIQAGILHNHNKKRHIQEISKCSIKPIDIVICNFPPLDKNVINISNFNIQHIDVGGPLMVRAAATNYSNVIVLVDKNDYQLLPKILKDFKFEKDKRLNLAIKAFQYCVKYDTSIVNFLKSKSIDF